MAKAPKKKAAKKTTSAAKVDPGFLYDDPKSQPKFVPIEDPGFIPD